VRTGCFLLLDDPVNERPASFQKAESVDLPTDIPPESPAYQQSSSHYARSPQEAGSSCQHRESLFPLLGGKKKRSGQPTMNRSKQAAMGIRTIAVLLVGLTLASVHLAEAQQAKVTKIGWLGTRPASGTSGSSGTGVVLELNRQALRDLGYIEGKNIVFEYRHADNKLERLPALADELVRLKVDVIFTPGINEALAAKNATRTIPIVFSTTADPVAASLVDSLARPGGNITGFTYIGAVLSGKRLELLKETVPKLSRVGVLWNPQDPASTQQWNESQLSARELGLQLNSMEVSSADKYEGAFEEATKARSAAVAVTQSALTNSYQKRIADLAAKKRLPAIYPRGDFVENGGLMSYGADQTEPSRRVASLVDKILKGAKPADLPVEQPTKFELVINLKTAKALGLMIPPVVMMRAEKVFK
jgi:putative tryptophan/tyrosine transport system substrate-binding protein